MNDLFLYKTSIIYLFWLFIILLYLSKTLISNKIWLIIKPGYGTIDRPYGGKKILTDILGSGNPELVAVYGRRRIGKTFLIRTHYAGKIIFEFSGIHSATLATQLQNFTNSMQMATGSIAGIAAPSSWLMAFNQLQVVLRPKLKKEDRLFF